MARFVFAGLGKVLTPSLSLDFEGTDGIDDDDSSVPVVVSLEVVPSSGTEGNRDVLKLFRDFRLLFFVFFSRGKSPNHSPSSLFDGAEPKQIALQKEGHSLFWAVD